MKISLNHYKFLLYVVCRLQRVYYSDVDVIPYRIDIWDLSVLVAQGLLVLNAPNVYYVTFKAVEIVLKPYQDDPYVSEERKKDS